MTKHLKAHLHQLLAFEKLAKHASVRRDKHHFKVEMVAKFNHFGKSAARNKVFKRFHSTLLKMYKDAAIISKMDHAKRLALAKKLNAIKTK